MEKKLRYNKEELDKTRKNLGDLSDKEARDMMKRLGGEVGEIYEGKTQAAPIRRSAPINRTRPASGGGARGGSASSSAQSASSSTATSPARYKATLPYIDTPTFKQFIKLYFNSYFKIMSFGNYLAALFSGGASEKVSVNFTRKIIWDNLALLQEFKNQAEEIVINIPGEKVALQNDTEKLYARFLLAVLDWDFSGANQCAHSLTRLGKDISVAHVVPLVREVYRNVISVVFVTDGMMLEILDQIEKIMQTSPGLQIREIRKQLTRFKADWKQVLYSVIKGFYPILMRACMKECLPINSFFSSHITKILDFLGANRFQLVLQKSEASSAGNSAKAEASAKGKTEEEGKEAGEDSENAEEETEETTPRKRAHSQILKRQFEFANTVFPDVGWMTADLETDFYAYFQPLFEFEEGANLISVHNPMQFTIVLTRIIEDLFSGIHHVDFFNDSVCKIDFEEMRSDIQNWYLYSADFLSKTYFPLLRDFVDNVYSNTKYGETPNGRRTMARIFWEQKTFILPYYKFELSYMPNETKKRNLKPLYKTVHTLSSSFAELSSSIDKSLHASQGKFVGQISGIGNPWDEYTFALANPVSKRLNAVLGGKNSPKRNNANLIKAISAFLFILDWWLNDKDSPAYDETKGLPYRHKPNSADPDFNVQLRTNVNEIFVNHIKQMAQSARSKPLPAEEEKASTKDEVATEAPKGDGGEPVQEEGGKGAEEGAATTPASTEKAETKAEVQGETPVPPVETPSTSSDSTAVREQMAKPAEVSPQAPDREQPRGNNE